MSTAGLWLLTMTSLSCRWLACQLAELAFLRAPSAPRLVRVPASKTPAASALYPLYKAHSVVLLVLSCPVAAMGYLNDAAPSASSGVSLVFLPARAAAVAVALSTIANSVAFFLVVRVGCGFELLDGQDIALLCFDAFLLLSGIVTGIVIIVRPGLLRVSFRLLTLPCTVPVQAFPPACRDSHLDVRARDHLAPRGKSCDRTRLPCQAIGVLTSYRRLCSCSAC